MDNWHTQPGIGVLDLRYLKLTGSLAEVSNHSHTVLTDIGTNTHAQIDTHIADTSDPHGAAMSISTSLTSPLIIGGTGTTSDLTLQTTSGVGATGADMHFLVGNNGATEAMTILNNGNVGIGTTSPGSVLDILKTSGGAKIKLTASDGSNDAWNVYEVDNDNFSIGYDRSASRFKMSAGDVLGAAGKDRIVMNNEITLSPAAEYDIAFNMSGAGNFIVNSNQLYIDTSTGNVGIGVTAPTAKLHLAAGTATANTAPLKFNSGTLNTTAEAGAIEFLTDDFYATITTGAARKAFVLDDGTRLTSGKIPVATTNGRLIDVTPQTELTDELTTITFTAPGTPDYAVADLTQTTPYGFASADEGQTVLSVIANLQTRVNELETKLVALGLLADAD